MNTVKVPIVGSIDGEDGQDPQVRFSGPGVDHTFLVAPSLLEEWIKKQEEHVTFDQRQVAYAEEQLVYWQKDLKRWHEELERGQQHLEILKSWREDAK